MYQGYLLETALQHLLSTVTMINHEAMDGLPLLIAPLCKRNQQGDIFEMESVMYCVDAVSPPPFPRFVWSNLSDGVAADHQATSIGLIVEAIAEQMVAAEEKVMAIFMVALGGTFGDLDLAQDQEVATNTVLVLGQDNEGHMAMGSIPSAYQDGCLMVSGEASCGVGDGHMSLLTLFWEMYRQSEKSAAKHN